MVTNFRNKKKFNEPKSVFYTIDTPQNPRIAWGLPVSQQHACGHYWSFADAEKLFLLLLTVVSSKDW